MNQIARSLAILGIAAIGASLSLAPANAADGYRLANVIDGDTLMLLNGRSVRLIGYDAPEAGQCGFEEATAGLATLLQRPVKVYHRSGSDRYGRILAYVKTRNGRDIGTVMLRQGLAVARYDSRDGYPWHPKQDLYRSLDSTNGEVCPQPAPEPIPPPVVPVEPPASVFYENCDAVRAAGAAPIYANQPGYGPHLDRDGDGIGCE